MRPAVLLNLTGARLNDMREAVVSVSTAPQGAIISRWLVKTREPSSQGDASEEEPKGGIDKIVMEGVFDRDEGKGFPCFDCEELSAGI